MSNLCCRSPIHSQVVFTSIVHHDFQPMVVTLWRQARSLLLLIDALLLYMTTYVCNKYDHNRLWPYVIQVYCYVGDTGLEPVTSTMST